ncbi:dual specificity protein phosphatase family protein [Patescibacteria group bacterium]|nr:dual specificity protein phosphatase family protein [Patescibacteria group bacterium]
MEEKNHHATEFEYNQITDEIFIGTNACCGTHFSKELLEKRITADMSLEKERVDQPFGVEFFFWLPTADEHSPNEDQFTVGVAILEQCVALKRKVYVHCKHGHGRAPTMVAAYFVAQGDTVEEAIGKIKKKRPVVHLNEEQVESLNHFKENIKK